MPAPSSTPRAIDASHTVSNDAIVTKCSSSRISPEPLCPPFLPSHRAADELEHLAGQRHAPPLSRVRTLLLILPGDALGDPEIASREFLDERIPSPGELLDAGARRVGSVVHLRLHVGDERRPLALFDLTNPRFADHLATLPQESLLLRCEILFGHPSLVHPSRLAVQGGTQRFFLGLPKGSQV